MRPKVSELKAIYDLKKEADEWLSSVPPDIKDGFFDNGYVNAHYKMIDELLKFRFGEHYQAVEWLLYEWQSGLGVGVNDFKAIIYTPQDYYDYLIKHEGWEA